MTTILIIYVVMLLPAAGVAAVMIRPGEKFEPDENLRTAWLVWLVVTVLWPFWAVVLLLVGLFEVSWRLGERIERVL